MYIIGLTLSRENMFIIRYYKTEEKIFLVGYAPSYCLYVWHFDMLRISTVTTYHYPRRRYTIYENETPEVKIK